MWSHLPVIFGPYVDGKYIPESPEFLLKLGRHKRVDMIIGINRDDGSLLTNCKSDDVPFPLRKFIFVKLGQVRLHVVRLDCIRM